MSINNIIPKQTDILKDDLQLWYFTKPQKNKIIEYLETCSIDDLKEVYPMSNVYFIPTWYYFLNDYDIAKKLIEKDNFKELLSMSDKEYTIKEEENNNENNDIFELSRAFKKIVTNLDTTLYYTQNNEVLLLLKKEGFQFKNNSFASENLYRVYEIIKAGVIEFNEDYLIENIFGIGDTYTSILQKILFNYENIKDSKQELVKMALTVNGFVELGCKTEIEYKKLISAKDYFISEKKNYKEIIEEYCHELHIFMQRLAFIEKMQVINPIKETKKKI